MCATSSTVSNVICLLDIAIINIPKQDRRDPRGCVVAKSVASRGAACLMGRYHEGIGRDELGGCWFRTTYKDMDLLSIPGFVVRDVWAASVQWWTLTGEEGDDVIR